MNATTKIKVIVFSAILLATIFMGIVLSKPKEGFCTFCPSYKCYGPGTCGPDCFCVTVGGEIGGTCMAVQKNIFK